LQQHFVLDDFPVGSRAMIKKTGCLRRFSTGEMVFHQGEKSESLILVESGLLDVGITCANGKRLTLNIIGAGSVVGEVGMLDGLGRTAEAAVLSDCQIRQFTRAEIFACFENSEQACQFFTQQLCRRLRWINEQSEHGRLLPATTVLARRVLMLAENCEGEWVSASQELLASQSGLTREYVNQILADWRAQGCIELRRGGFKIQRIGYFQSQ